MTRITRKKALSFLWDGAILTLGTAVAAAAIFFFMLPSRVAVGSGSALAMVLASFIPLPVSVLNFILTQISRSLPASFANRNLQMRRSPPLAVTRRQSKEIRITPNTAEG